MQVRFVKKICTFALTIRLKVYVCWLVLKFFMTVTEVVM